MKRTAVVGALAALLGSGALVWAIRAQSFPHQRHARLFPTCESCHAGVYSGDSTALYSVTPALCSGCHTGEQLPKVDWAGPAPRESNLRFSHARHPKLGCPACHRIPGAEAEMAVQAARPETCLACHAAGAEEHFAAEVPCATCHLALAEATTLSANRITGLPQPRGHASPDFLQAHGGAAAAGAQRCAVCHARESCTRCHINADRLESIQSLSSDDRVADLSAARDGRWPLPPSHGEPDWGAAHGPQAMATIETCANCHAAPSCASCHGEPGPDVIAELPLPAPDGPQGVQLKEVRVPGHTPNFVVAHASAATANLPNCSACHAETFCVDCHDGAASPGFHPANFAMRHAAEATSVMAECGACHSAEVFCRDCHASSGVAAQGRSGGGYHDASGNWLLGHGQAARLDLESCTTCHQQTYCLQCHSAKSGWRVSPHGPDFDPDDISERSQISCGICHFGFQLDSP